MKHDRALAYAAFAVVCVVWGTTYLAIRIAVTTMTPFLLTGARYLFGGIVLFIVAKLHGDCIPRNRRVLEDDVLCGVLMVAIGNLTVVWAEQWVPSGFAALFVGTAPFWATLIELLRRSDERLDLRRAGLPVAVRLRARLHVLRLRRAPPAHHQHGALRLREPGRGRDPRLAGSARAVDVGVDDGHGGHSRRGSNGPERSRRRAEV